MLMRLKEKSCYFYIKLFNSFVYLSEGGERVRVDHGVTLSQNQHRREGCDQNNAVRSGDGRLRCLPIDPRQDQRSQSRPA